MSRAIFLLDNDPEYRDAFKAAAEGRGLYVVAEDIGQHDVKTEAGRIPKEQYDLAFIDYRARDDDDINDDSGLKFADILHNKGEGIFTVLVTGYLPEVRNAFNMLRRNELGGVVGKKEVDVHVLLRCVEHFFRYAVFPNGIAKFVWLGVPLPEGAEPEEISESYLWRFLRQRLKLDDEVEIEDLELVLRALISPCVTSVGLKVHPHQGQGGTLLLRANVTNVDAPVSEELAIKLGKKSIVKDEMLRYDRFVGPLPDGAAAQLRFRAETERLAAIAYSWVGDSVEEGVSFADLVRNDGDLMGWRVRRAAVRRLFATTLHSWYKVYRESGKSLADALPPGIPKNLWYHYMTPRVEYPSDKPLSSIRFPLDEVEDQIVGNDAQGWTFHFEDIRETLRNPVDWAKKTGRAIDLARLCPCHGDMHVGNVYVLPDSSPRLIDFGRTDLSHVFRDFAALEASIRMTCVGTPDVALIRKAEGILSQVRNLGDPIDCEKLGDDEKVIPLREALRVTNVIRRAALDAYVKEDKEDEKKAFREYLFALVMYLLRYAAGQADECASEERKAEDILKQPVGDVTTECCDEWRRRRDAEDVLKRRARRIWAAHYAAAKAAELAKKLSSTPME